MANYDIYFCISCLAMSKSLTHGPFDSYENNRKPTVYNPSAFRPFQTVYISHTHTHETKTFLKLFDFIIQICIAAHSFKVKRKSVVTLKPVVNGWNTTANSCRFWNSFIWATLCSASCTSIWTRWYNSFSSGFWLYSRPTQHEHSPLWMIWQCNGLSGASITLRTYGVGTIFTNVLWYGQKFEKIHCKSIGIVTLRC